MYMLYTRFVPVIGIPCIDISSNQLETINVKLDIRDYNESFRQEVKGSILMPVAYLNRHYRDIPEKEIHLIASDSTERNLAVRILHNKGYRVTGYSLMDCGCKGK